MVVARYRELLKKYGGVALGVHTTVSVASIAGFYLAIRSNVDVEGLLRRAGLSSFIPKEKEGEGEKEEEEEGKRKSRLAAGGGGALALAFLCNKALFPVRVPITVALTPPVARFLAKRHLFKVPL